MKTMGELSITAFRPVLYEIDEPVHIGTDAKLHPYSTMDAGAEFLIMRPLKVKKIADLP